MVVTSVARQNLPGDEVATLKSPGSSPDQEPQEQGMGFQTIAGGFDIAADDQLVLNKQRAITKAINDRFIQVGATFLKASSKNPYDDEWFKRNYHDVDLQSWVDDPELRQHNVGFNLQLGWMDVDIDAEDPEFNRCVVAAMDHLRIDTRFQFGRASVGEPSHVMLQLGEEESQNFEFLTRFEPREFRLGGKRYHVQLRSFPTNISAANLAKSAKQTVMPGSIYTHKTKPNAYDISVWFANKGIASDVKYIAATTPRRVNFNEIVRAITFGTFLYCVKEQWVEGNRQMAAQKLGGWLARIVADSQAMNNHEAIATDVYCPVDDDSIAESLIHFVCGFMGDDEAHMRVRAFRDAQEKLHRNADAKIPGWPAIEQMLGGERVVALRTVFMPGSDVSVLTQMAERYVYDETDNRYIDRQRFFTIGNYVHEGSELERRHKGDTIRISGKPREAFKVFESSDMRKRVGFRDLYPNLNAGGVYRITGLGDILSDDEDDETSLPVFNTWRGWPVQPTNDPNPDFMADIVARLDKVLGYLTQDKEEQIKWVKQWLAWTIQNPGDKQQIAWVVVGEQGIGKSWIGSIFMNALMGGLWGTASPKVLEGDFNIGPFKDKMFVFIDEAKFHSEAGTDEIKKLIRGVDVPGMEKFMEARNYRIFARLMFASNRLDMNIGQTNVRDRALFYTRAYDREFTDMTEHQFRSWAETLKPFFTEFTEMMKRKDVREHFMRYFMEFETSKYEVESIKYSSSTDSAIVLSNMSWPRRIAKYIIEDARIHEDLDITYPFTMGDLNRRVGELCKEMGLKNVQAARVLNEFEMAGVIEKVVMPDGVKRMRFVSKLGTLLEEFGEAISVQLEKNYKLDSKKDYGRNENDGSERKAWRGAKKGVVQSRF
jgi:hypothetical protein